MNATGAELVRYLRTLAAGQANDAYTDRQLLEQFVTRREEASFAALLRRHGPMVLGVCRRVLSHDQDAEDAFQATFLVLAQKAGCIRKQEAVGSWLHGVAYHIAEKLRVQKARRLARERKALSRPAVDPGEDVAWREIRCLLDSELARLPERYRGPLVLCYLQGKTQDEAARQLALSLRTFRRRLQCARDLLVRRLTRRGVALSGALSAPLLTDAATQAALPPLLAAATVRAGLAAAMGQATDALVSAQVVALVEGGAGGLLAKKASIAVVVLASLMLGLGGLLAHRAASSHTHAETPAVATLPQPARSAGKDAAIEIKGRVLDPDGKPFAGARVLLLPDGNPKKTEKPVGATTDQQGRFRFTACPADFGPQGKGKIVATAKGWGPDWISVDAKSKSAEITLRLVADDVPIEGRVLDLEGKPIAGVALRVLHLGKVASGADLKDWLDKNMEMRRKGTYLNMGGLDVIRADLLDLPMPAPTGADGAFRLTGFGRDRVVRLDIEGPNIVWRKMWAVTRPGPARGFIPGFWGVYGSRFEYVASPCKPIVGTVREKGSGKPLAGITVGSVMHGDIETTTDKNGRYRIVGVAKNPRYGIVAEGDHHFNCTRHDIADTPGLEPITVHFELERVIVMRRRLTNKATGEPVRGSVHYCARADNPNLKDYKEISSFQHVHLTSSFDTAPDGSFAALAIPGSGLLCLRAENGDFVDAKPERVKGAPLKPVPPIVLDGYQALVPIEVMNDDPKNHFYEIALDPGRSLQGVLVDPDGQPLPGVRVAGLTSRAKANTEDSPDRAGLKGSDFTVTALAPGQDRQLVFFHPQKNLGKVLRLHGDEKGPLTVRLEALGALAGRMLKADGQRLAGLTVLAVPAVRQFKVTTTTDKDGKFRVDGLLPEMQYLLILSRGDPEKRGTIRVYQKEGVTVESGKINDLGDLNNEPEPLP